MSRPTRGTEWAFRLRDVAIRELIAADPRQTYDAIGTRFGISSTRVAQIAKAAGLRRGTARTWADVASRFWPKVAKSDGCWLWTGAIGVGGYGKLSPGGRQGPRKAHRISWEIHNGPIPDGLNVLHHCDNPPCVRPDHLFLGTLIDNARDMARKARGNTAKLTADQVTAIREAVRAGVSQADLSRQYGLAHSSVSAIVRRQTWTLVP